MGIVTFGVVMIGMDLFFTTDSECKRLGVGFKGFSEKAHAFLQNLKKYM